MLRLCRFVNVYFDVLSSLIIVRVGIDHLRSHLVNTRVDSSLAIFQLLPGCAWYGRAAWKAFVLGLGELSNAGDICRHTRFVRRLCYIFLLRRYRHMLLLLLHSTACRPTLIVLEGLS